MSVWADNPQAAEIDALIERAGPLTAVECDRLVAAWVTARTAARAAAWVAARVAAWDAAGDAAGDAARFAVRFAVRNAVRDAADAAVALVVRDLIEEGTPWDQAAYDLLTGPWRRIIGPVHPDDEVLR